MYLNRQIIKNKCSFKCKRIRRMPMGDTPRPCSFTRSCPAERQHASIVRGKFELKSSFKKVY